MENPAVAVITTQPCRNIEALTGLQPRAAGVGPEADDDGFVAAASGATNHSSATKPG